MSDRSNSRLTATLAELFPACFVVNSWEPHRPLKVGISDDLVAAGVLLPAECKVLRWYTQRRMYQAALAAGGPRYDLDGNVAGEVTPDQIAGARASLAEMDRRQVATIAAAKAAHRAETAKREASAAAIARSIDKTAQRAAGKVSHESKGPAPYHRTTPQKIAPQPAQLVNMGRLSLAGLKAAFAARKQREAAR